MFKLSSQLAIQLSPSPFLMICSGQETSEGYGLSVEEHLFLLKPTSQVAMQPHLSTLLKGILGQKQACVYTYLLTLCGDPRSLTMHCSPSHA